MYFVVAMMADVDPMYQFSLKYFSNVRDRERGRTCTCTCTVHFLF